MAMSKDFGVRNCDGQKFGKVDDFPMRGGLRPMVLAYLHASAHGLHR